MKAAQRRPLVHFEAENLGYALQSKHASIILPRLTLTLHEGERIALLGQSGTGKSTLLTELRQRLERQAAWCPQHHGLVPQLAVYHNVFMGRLPEYSALANLWNLVRPLRRHWQEVAALCLELGLDGLMSSTVIVLSCGQTQLVTLDSALFQTTPFFI